MFTKFQNSLYVEIKTLLRILPLSFLSVSEICAGADNKALVFMSWQCVPLFEDIHGTPDQWKC
jgi:hypothetical protein